MLHRLRVGRATRAAMIVTALVVLIALDRAGWLLYRSDMQRYDGRTFAVVRVIDGDTLDIAAPDGESPTTRVRLWGIDAPELARSDPPTAAEPFADQAHGMLRQLCEDRPVTLHLEADRPRGRYGRLLAHVQLDDGTVVNEALLSAGLAAFDGRFMHGRYDAYRQLADEARQNGVGQYAP
jgi:micrococcal nuclease